MIRSKFDSELEKLNSDLILMGAMCEEAISGVIRALETDDKALAKKLVSEDDKIDMKEREIENECLKLMLQQQPVAKDLRLISSAIKMITDMERIGDQAADIGRNCFLCELERAHIASAPDRHVPGDGQNGDGKHRCLRAPRPGTRAQSARRRRYRGRVVQRRARRRHRFHHEQDRQGRGSGGHHHDRQVFRAHRRPRDEHRRVGGIRDYGQSSGLERL